jgi:maltose alpha-D-glucosyltransferase/alpha-amylase
MAVDARRSDVISLLDNRTLRDFIQRQRWFGGKARAIASARIADWADLAETDAWLLVVELRFEDGGVDEYVVPFAFTTGSAAGAIARDYPASVAAHAEGGGVVHDALFDDRACRALLSLLRRGGDLPTRKGRLHATAIHAAAAGAEEPDGTIQRTAPDQSNTSVIFGRRLIMKMFRHLEDGPNPDVELSTFLTRRGFRYVPSTVGAVEYARDGRAPASVLMLQRFVENRGNGWEVALEQLARYFDGAGTPPASGASDSGEALRPYLALPAILGRRTGEMHVHLGSGEGDAFAPEAYTREDLESTSDRMREHGAAALALLQRSLERLDTAARADADAVLANRAAIISRFDVLRELADGGKRIRCHGDYHLGQTLVTDDGVMILDFEGEPARSLQERRGKASPLRDVAGMLRSFSYAAATARAHAVKDGVDRDPAALAVLWEQQATATFTRAYVDAVRDAQLLAAAEQNVERLLQAFVLDKALYEVAYELNNRPDFAGIPLAYLVHGTAQWKR